MLILVSIVRIELGCGQIETKFCYHPPSNFVGNYFLLCSTQAQSDQLWGDEAHPPPGPGPELCAAGVLQPGGGRVHSRPLQPHGHLQTREQEVHPFQVPTVPSFLIAKF